MYPLLIHNLRAGTEYEALHGNGSLPFALLSYSSVGCLLETKTGGTDLSVATAALYIKLRPDRHQGIPTRELLAAARLGGGCNATLAGWLAGGWRVIVQKRHTPQHVTEQQLNSMCVSFDSVDVSVIPGVMIICTVCPLTSSLVGRRVVPTAAAV